MDLKEIDRVDPGHHWYYQSKLSALQRALSEYAPHALRFVDVGAGSGFFSSELAPFDSGAQVVCVDPNYESESSERNGALRFVRTTQDTDAEVYLFIDVLEHVVDDVGLIRHYTESAAPGALALITVPAFKSMWSAHDTYLEHYRRYRLGDLKRVVERAGLEVLREQYLFGSIFPFAWMVRRLRRGKPADSDLRPVAAPVNWLLTRVLVAEHRFTRNRVAGLTAFVVARTPLSSVEDSMCQAGSWIP